MKQLSQFEIWADQLTGVYGKQLVLESEQQTDDKEDSSREYDVEQGGQELNEGTLTTAIARPIKAWAARTNSETAREIGIALGMADIRAVAMDLLELDPKLQQEFLKVMGKLGETGETKEQATALRRMFEKFLENAPRRETLDEFDEGITSKNPQGIPESGHGYSNVPQILPEEKMADKMHELFHKRFAKPVAEEYDPSYDPEYRPYQRPERDPDWEREAYREREWEQERKRSEREVKRRLARQ